jgi:hypothetical protein
MVVDATTASCDVVLGATMLKHLTIKNVLREELPWEPEIALMVDQAQSEERRRLALKKQWRRGAWDKTP